MKRLSLTLAAAMLFFSFVAAQHVQGSLKGKLVDTAGGKPLNDATVSILHTNDSTLISYTLTDAKGIFEIKNVETGTYRLLISHQGFIEIKKNITIAGKQQLNLGDIPATKDVQMLGEVIVTSEAPIVVKGDTTQFNASGFKTKPNATAEDLIKKLPGADVDRDGNVKIQGDQVQKIYVDGKEFFGTDPKMATKNLTADMIESVQVYDDMSEQAKFTKIDDGTRIKTINIKLKKDRHKGYFGRVLAGYGDQDRYKGNLSLNKFDEKQRISVVANSNNVNEQGFSIYDAPSSGGSGRGNLRGGGGTGINKTWSSGINYVDQWGDKIKISGSYFISNSNNHQEQNLYRKSEFTDSTAILDRTTASNNKRQGHQFNLRFEYQLDSATSILYTPSLSVQNSSNQGIDTSFTFSKIPALNYLSITGKTANNGKTDGMNWNNNFLFRHRFSKNGRTFTIGWNNNIGNSNSNAYILSANQFYLEDGSPYRSINQNQQSDSRNTTRNNIVSTSYTEPFGKNKLLELNYAFTHNVSNSNKQTYDYDSTSLKFDNPNLLLTNTFENTFVAHRTGINFREQHTKYNYQAGLSVQKSMQESDSYQAATGKDSLIKQNYTNFFPTANFNFMPSRGKNLRFGYSGRTNAPTASQLQNVLDVSDPLNVRTGNPDLKQEFNHNFNLGYNTFDIKTFRFIAANLNFSTTSNRIVNSIDTLTSGIQLNKPQNVNGFYRASSFITLGFSSKDPKLKGSNLSFTNNLSYNHDVSLLYKQKNIGQTINVTQGVAGNLSKEKFDLSLRANITYTRVHYSVNKTLNEHYLTQTYSGDFSYSFPRDIIFLIDFDYFINSGRAEGFNQSIPLLNAAISKQFFKKKNGEIKFTVNDILNQNQSTSTSSIDNYVQYSRSLVLRRYFMISFLYNLNKMGGKKK